MLGFGETKMNQAWPPSLMNSQFIERQDSYTASNFKTRILKQSALGTQRKE